jgi:sugar phosphate isomerase/epimerase
VADRIFGVSTRLFRDARLTRDELVHIAAHGFDAIELYVAPGHFDPQDGDAVAQLGEWLSDTRLALHAVHTGDDPIDAALAALAIANQLPFAYLVMHRPASNTERTLETLTEAASGLGVKVALEVRGTADSSPEALVALLEDEIDELGVGICLDFGRAHVLGDLGEAIETVSGHLMTTHLHDNNGKRNDHLVPYAGTIPWDTAMVETQKVGYDGAFIFELAPAADPVDVLKKAARARTRLEQSLIVF